jgi:hypothetical protein
VQVGDRVGGAVAHRHYLAVEAVGGGDTQWVHILGAFSGTIAGRLRGARQGATAPPAPPARGSAPWNPDLMRSHRRGQARMPAGNPCGQQRADGAGVAVQCTHSCSASAIRLLVACAARGWGASPRVPSG